MPAIARRRPERRRGPRGAPPPAAWPGPRASGPALAVRMSREPSLRRRALRTAPRPGTRPAAGRAWRSAHGPTRAAADYGQSADRAATGLHASWACAVASSISPHPQQRHDDHACPRYGLIELQVSMAVTARHGDAVPAAQAKLAKRPGQAAGALPGLA